MPFLVDSKEQLIPVSIQVLHQHVVVTFGSATSSLCHHCKHKLGPPTPTTQFANVIHE